MGRTLEDESASRLRVLMGLLADAEAQRCGLHVGPSDLQAAVRWYRARFDLVRRVELDAFLAHAELDVDGFTDHIRTLCNVAAVQRHHEPAIDALIPRYEATFSVRDWILRQEEKDSVDDS